MRLIFFTLKNKVNKDCKGGGARGTNVTTDCAVRIIRLEAVCTHSLIDDALFSSGVILFVR